MAYAGQQSGSLQGATATQQETRMQALARTIDERATHLANSLSRIDSFLNRAEPTPEAAGISNKDPQPIDLSFNGVNRRLSSIGEMLDRLSNQCDRLERLA